MISRLLSYKRRFPVKGMKPSYAWCAYTNFRLTLKREFYASQYGSYEGIRTERDFLSMYNMGGEL